MPTEMTKAIIKKCVNKYCPVCNGLIEIAGDNTSNVEYVRTKRGTDLFIHSGCIKDWGRSY